MFRRTLMLIVTSMGILSSPLLGLAFIDRAHSVTFTPPEDGVPEDASSASSRSGDICPDVSLSEDISAGAPLLSSVLPLIPPTQYGQTVLEHPTILVYVPPTTAPHGLFSIKTPDGQTLYQTAVPLSPSGGIMELSVPPEFPPLEEGVIHRWYFFVECKQRTIPQYPIQGTIERVSINDDNLHSCINIESVDAALMTASAYGQAGLWYDTVNLMFRLYSLYPSNSIVQQEWNELLISSHLDALLAIESIVSESILEPAASP